MIRAIAVFVLLAGVATGAAAQAYPAQSVRVIVGAAPGSDADIAARVISAKLYEIVGRQFPVENMPSAAGNLAVETVGKSAPDGYTLLVATVDNVINTTLSGKPPFDLARDFTPIALATAIPNLLVVHPSVPAKSVKELVALAKGRPGQLGFASNGAGTVQHLSGELFMAMAGIQLVHVAYKSSTLSETDFLGGKVALMFSPPSAVLPHVQAGRLRALAITTASRVESLPDLPTVAEAGVAGYEATSWYGYVAPAKTPPAVVGRLNLEVGRVLSLPDIRNQFSILGMEILGGPPERFADTLRGETAKWTKVIRLSGVKAE